MGKFVKGYKIVPYCPRCGTALSSHEVAQGYKDVTEKSVYVKLRSAMKEKTKIDVPYTTDILPAGETRDPNETAVILGNTNYDESKQATENANYGDYSLKIIGNKIVLSFTSKDDGIDLVNIIFLLAIRSS